MAEYADGAPCWVQLLTRDADAARRFYAALFGWEFEDDLVTLGGRPIAALVQDPEAAEPPGWTVYLRTPDVAASMAAIEAQGGTVVEGPAAGYALARDP
ncbi:MAG: VOC family protein, partial [Nonomuraea sp.]|nr:VOC family protein [Nonomuraea sp.]